jgi:trimethylguanosine synthase
LTPEAVSDYIAGKCYDCKVVMDAFSGIGHNATKLGTVCEKVICVEEEAKKYNCLINNVKCYEIYNVELFLKPFLEISLKSRVDAVLVHPYLSNEHYSLQSFCESKNFKPHLSQVIKKTL